MTFVQHICCIARYRSTFHTSSHLKFISSSSPRAVSSEKNFQLGFAEGKAGNDLNLLIVNFAEIEDRSIANFS